ncbi:MAG: DNA replication/repair protein RecF [Steroidobacteraceae bacterium]
MGLLQLDIEHFRCIEQARLVLAPDANLIFGSNASGKTSVLEAIFLMGTGHSFRTHQTDLLIQHGQTSFTTVGRVLGKQGTEVIGIRGTGDNKEARVNGETARSLAELARRLPVQVIDPEVHRLLEDGPIRRRRFLDWGVFHVEHRFHEAWRRYQRALRQRNAALKAKQVLNALRIWDQEIIEQGELVAGYRDQYLSDLRPFAVHLGRQLLNLDIDLEHQRGWKRQSSLEAALVDNLSRDQLRGATSVGPHRADLILKVGHVTAKDRISRGQQKMLACALILAQQAQRAAIGTKPACLLVDDPAAELDVDNLGKLLAAVAAIPTQLVVTSLTKDVLEFFPRARLFHVEHGAVQAVA